MTIWNTPLRAFADEVASSNPTPGGGSVSLVAGALGAGLIAMAINVSRKGKAGLTHGVALEDLFSKIETLRNEISDLADADILVFQEFMAAFNLPKHDEVHRAARLLALADAALVASNLPLKSGEVIVKALNLAHEVRPLVSKMIVSDVDAGMHLLCSAGLGVLLNVEANLAWLPDNQQDVVVKRATAIRAAIRASRPAV